MIQRWKAARRAALLCLALVAAPLGAATAGERVKVVATFSILGDMVHEVGGDDVALTVLVPPGSDTHVYEPSTGDARALAGADLAVVNGLGFEGWMTRLIEASGTTAPVAVVSVGVQPLGMVEGHDHAGEASAPAAGDGAAGRAADPHAWQDLANGQLYVRNIAAALAASDPGHAAGYRRRAEAYAQRLAALDAWVREQIAQVPPARRKVITSHDAFGYFARAYGVEFLAPTGVSTEAEPTAADLAALIGQIKNEGVRAVFIESMTSPRLIEQLARDTGAAVGGALYSDSLSEPGGPADTYVAMFRHNVPALVAAMRE